MCPHAKSMGTTPTFVTHAISREAGVHPEHVEILRRQRYSTIWMLTGMRRRRRLKPRRMSPLISKSHILDAQEGQFFSGTIDA